MSRKLFSCLLFICLPCIGNDTLVEPLTTKKVIDYIKTHPEIAQADDPVDALLGKLPRSFRLRRIFMYRSGSNQPASALSPRVFMISADSKFVMSFGDETVIADETPTSEAPRNSKGGEKLYSIEMQDFDIALDVPFEYTGYKFREDSTELPVGSTEINPATCMSCHKRQNIPRPNWSFYNSWPGAMGSQNQASGPDWGDKDIQDKLLAWVQTEQSDDGPEAKLIRKFLQRVQKNPGRYRHVFQDHKTATPDQIHYTHEFIQNGYKRVKASDESTNLRLFSKGALYNNFLRVHRDLSKKDVYKYIKYALLGSMLGCGEVEPGEKETFSEFIPKDIRKMLADRGDAMSNIIADSVASAKRLDLSNQRQHLPGEQERAGNLSETGMSYAYRPSHQQKAHRARYIMRSVGMDIYDWFLTRQSEIGIFEVDPNREELFAYMIYQDIKHEMPKLANYVKVEEDPNGQSNFRTLDFVYKADQKNPREAQEKLCEELKNKSLEQYSKIPKHLLESPRLLHHGDFKDDEYLKPKLDSDNH